jgi:hypothetical protein
MKYDVTLRRQQLYEGRVLDVASDELELRMAPKRREVLQATRTQIIDDDNLVAIGKQSLRQM